MAEAEKTHQRAEAERDDARNQMATQIAPLEAAATAATAWRERCMAADAARASMAASYAERAQHTAATGPNPVQRVSPSLSPPFSAALAMRSPPPTFSYSPPRTLSRTPPAGLTAPSAAEAEKLIRTL